MKASFLGGFLIITITALAFVASDLERIGMAIQTGNARELAKYFDNTVEITVFDKEETYSKAQAEMVLKDFFSKHRPSSFRIIHNGNSNQGSEYGIGTLITDNGTFRTYVYLKQKGSSLFIQEIRFEKD